MKILGNPDQADDSLGVIAQWVLVGEIPADTAVGVSDSFQAIPGRSVGLKYLPVLLGITLGEWAGEGWWRRCPECGMGLSG